MIILLKRLAVGKMLTGSINQRHSALFDFGGANIANRQT